MVESTRMKGISAKLDTMLVVMDYCEERLLAAMDQCHEHVTLIEQSINYLSQILDNQQPKLHDTFTALLAAQPITVWEEQDSHYVPSAHMRIIRLDFPRFDCSDVLQWIFHAE